MMTVDTRRIGVALVVFLTARALYSGESSTSPLAEAIRSLDGNVLSGDQQDAARSMVREDQRNRLKAVNSRSSRQWYAIENRQQWEQFREPRLKALRDSLGTFPADPKPPRVHVTSRFEGDGYRVENILFESREDFWVTANLYLPTNSTTSPPGILICHSHHTPKRHGELQDMGMTWARAGCAVLVMDQLGHGERRQHPFESARDFDGEFRVSRQDYYFRFDNGMQLHLAGESLVGWMAWDMMRGVDVLLSHAGADDDRLILLGAVAGGGDPAAVTAALDDRIDAVVPFNFGGPQPETRFPLPEDVETSFNYAGSGSWESTRNLRSSAEDGFLPWVIVGGVAPRKLVFAHEFSWDRERDPVWKRLNAIYRFYGAKENLAYTHGRGELRGRPPEATHCTHIGKPHRVKIHEAFQSWFGIEAEEFSDRRDAAELLCWTKDLRAELKPKSLSELLVSLADERLQSERKQRSALPGDQQRKQLRSDLERVLGPVTPVEKSAVTFRKVDEDTLPGALVERFVLQVERSIFVPVLFLIPQDRSTKPPIVIAVAQGGKERFLKERSDDIAQLLKAGIAVCLPDVRGTGEIRSGNDRGQYSAATGRSSTELMLGGTMVGAKLRDLRAVLTYLRSRDDIDSQRAAVWGDSFAPLNPPNRDFQIPRRISGRPHVSEPLGGTLALLLALFEEEIDAVYVHGGLGEFSSVLSSPFVYVPHDVIVPGWLTVADLPDITAALAPRPVQLNGLVDHFNRRMTGDAVNQIYERAARDKLRLTVTPSSPASFLSAIILQ